MKQFVIIIVFAIISFFATAQANTSAETFKLFGKTSLTIGKKVVQIDSLVGTVNAAGDTVIYGYFNDKVVSKSKTTPSVKIKKLDSDRSESENDSLKGITSNNTPSTASNLRWANLLLVLALLFFGIGLIVYAIMKKSSPATTTSAKDENGLKLVPPTQNQLREDNRMDFIPVVNPNHAPAYPNMPSRQELNSASLPSMVMTAYTNLPNFVRDYGVISQITNIKHGVLNGRFSMEHADGTVSTQEFKDEPGFRAKAKLANGKTMLIYSRYSCLNNVRAIKIAEVIEQPSFTPETEVKTTKSSITTTTYHPERIAS